MKGTKLEVTKEDLAKAIEAVGKREEHSKCCLLMQAAKRGFGDRVAYINALGSMCDKEGSCIGGLSCAGWELMRLFDEKQYAELEAQLPTTVEIE
jgi:hypothetical protein